MSSSNGKADIIDVEEIIAIEAEEVIVDEIPPNTPKPNQDVTKQATESLVGDLAIASDVINEDILTNDKLTLAAKDNEADDSLYNIIIEEIAQEAANISNLRKKASQDDLVTRSILSEKRILALDKAAKMIQARSKDRKEGANGKIDFLGEGFQNVLGFMTGLILEAVEDTGMQKATQDRFLLKLKQKLTGFEELAEDVYHGRTKKNARSNATAFSKTRE